MTAYLTQASVEVKMSKEAARRLKDDHAQIIALEGEGTSLDYDSALYAAQEISIEDVREGIWFSAKPGCDFSNEYVAELVYRHLSRENSDEIVTWTYANTANRPVLDGFGGGVVAVTRDGWEIVDAIQQQQDIADEIASRLRAEKLADRLMEESGFETIEDLREALDLDEKIYDLYALRASEIANLPVEKVLAELLVGGANPDEFTIDEPSPSV